MPKKERRLWLNIKFRFKGKRPPKWKIKERLLQSIEAGEDTGYSLPRGWDVILEWRNKESGEMRSGPWAEELSASAESSSGFDIAVAAYLERWRVERVALVRKKTRRITHRPGQSRRKIRPHGKRRKKAKSHRKRRTKR